MTTPLDRLKSNALSGLVESFAGSLTQRGTNAPPTDALTKLAQLAYERGASDARHQSEGIQRDVRERAAALVDSFLATYKMAPDSRAALAFLLELFVNALLEARETKHVVDWSNPDQVELYTLAVEAESKRYEEINLKIAAAEKAERTDANTDFQIRLDPKPRNPFADMALAAIPNWFDEMRPLPQGSPDETPMYRASTDPLFAAALNRAFAIGVLSVTQEHPEPTE